MDHTCGECKCGEVSQTRTLLIISDSSLPPGLFFLVRNQRGVFEAKHFGELRTPKSFGNVLAYKYLVFVLIVDNVNLIIGSGKHQDSQSENTTNYFSAKEPVISVS